MFAQLVEAMMSQIVRNSSQGQRIDVVSDVYRETSVRHAEGYKRASGAISSSGGHFRSTRSD